LATNENNYLEITGGLLSLHLLEEMMATLLEEDGIFGSYVDARHLQQVVGVCNVYLVTIDHNRSRTFWVWLVFYQLICACPVLGAYFLTISAYAYLAEFMLSCLLGIHIRIMPCVK